MALSVDPEPQTQHELTGPAPEDHGFTATGETKRATGRAGLILVAILALLIGGLGGGLIGYALGSAQAEQEQEQALTDLRDEIAGLQSDNAAFGEDLSALEDDKAALEDRLASTDEQMGACQAAVALATEVIENRQAAIDLVNDPSLPLDPFDPAWDPVLDALLQSDSEFERLVGRFEVVGMICMASVESGAAEA